MASGMAFNASNYYFEVFKQQLQYHFSQCDGLPLPNEMDCFDVRWLLFLIFAAVVFAKSDDGEDKEDDTSWLPPNATIADQIAKINEEDGAEGLIDGDITPLPHETENGNEKRNAIRNRGQIWRTRIVPYMLHTSLTPEGKEAIRQAIKEFERKSCIRFKRVTASTKEFYIRFHRGAGCQSVLGMASLFFSKSQDLSIGHGCEHKGTVIHEIMHALGFFHEQSRYDRDEYIKVHEDRIMPGFKRNFIRKEIESITSLGLPYDYDGIMHYGAYAFTKYRNLPVIEKLKKTGGKLGNRKGFSVIDLKQLNLLYDCKTSSRTNSWSSWSAYSKCFDLKDGNGKREHSQRFCFRQDLKLCPGANRYGTQRRSRPCRSKPTTTGSRKPMNGGWSSYGPYGSCTKSCGGGYKFRHRLCTNPAPANGGRNCQGTGRTRLSCNTQPCQGRMKIDGGWSSWSAGTPCSRSCGGGMSWRYRTCTNPRPKNGGKHCQGHPAFGSPCNWHPCKAAGSCQIKFTNWNWYFYGSIKSLTHHNMDCGSGKVLSMFHLEFKHAQIRYKYQCCVAASSCTNQRKQTDWINAAGDKATILSKIVPYCGPNGYISGIRLERNPNVNQFRYNLQCCMYRPSHVSCEIKFSQFTDNGRGKAFYLDRQTIQCSKGHAFNFIHLSPSASANKWRYLYQCCKF